VDQRIKGQEIEIRVLSGANVIGTLQSIENFSSNYELELKQEGFIGEKADRFDSSFKGYKGSFGNQPNDANYHQFQDLIVQKATREQPALVFNIIRTEFFPNGSTAVTTFLDVEFGAIPTDVGTRADYTKQKFEWACSDKDTQINNLP